MTDRATWRWCFWVFVFQVQLKLKLTPSPVIYPFLLSILSGVLRT